MNVSDWRPTAAKHPVGRLTVAEKAINNAQRRRVTVIKRCF
jgi:hypothetical protein